MDCYLINMVKFFRICRRNEGPSFDEFDSMTQRMSPVLWTALLRKSTNRFVMKDLAYSHKHMTLFG